MVSSYSFSPCGPFSCTKKPVASRHVPIRDHLMVALRPSNEQESISGLAVGSSDTEYAIRCCPLKLSYVKTILLSESVFQGQILTESQQSKYCLSIDLFPFQFLTIHVNPIQTSIFSSNNLTLLLIRWGNMPPLLLNLLRCHSISLLHIYWTFIELHNLFIWTSALDLFWTVLIWNDHFLWILDNHEFILGQILKCCLLMMDLWTQTQHCYC